MESTLPVIAGSAVLPATLDGLLAAVFTTGAPVGSTDVSVVVDSDERDTVNEPEFWDACWTLEDEWMPRVERNNSRPRRFDASAPPTVFALL